MEPKNSPESQLNNNHQSSSSVAGHGQAYIPLDKKQTRNNVKNYLAAGLILLFLGGIGAMAYKNLTPDQSQNIEKVTENKSELVASILAITDEQHHEDSLDKDKDLDDKTHDHKILSFEEKQKKQARAKAAIEDHIKSNEKDNTKAELGLYKGILTRCYIDGHDVHWIDENGLIISHVLLDSTIDPKAEVARSMINQSTENIIVIMHEKGYEVYGANGDLIKVHKD
jgi:hypothetical protein